MDREGSLPPRASENGMESSLYPLRPLLGQTTPNIRGVSGTFFRGECVHFVEPSDETKCVRVEVLTTFVSRCFWTKTIISVVMTNNT